MNENRAKIYYTSNQEESNAPRKTIGLLAAAWREQIQILEREENRVKSGDSEALHRFRISLRKTRALIKIFSASLPDTKQLIVDFDWIATLTNPIRDADIILQDAFASGHGKILSTLIDEIKSNRHKALQSLITAIESRRYRLLIMQWRTYVAELPMKKISVRGGLRRNRGFLYEILLMQAYKLLKKSSHSQEQDAPSKNLHKLRIRSKRLRYFIESFPQLLKNSRIKPIHKRLKQLQVILGQHQDNVMLADLLNKQAETIDEALPKNSAAMETLAMWITLAEKHQQLARARYHRAVTKLAAASKHLPTC